ncbi:RagB/SusD family nutrient uptake outer membrane protein [Mucilaginibacter sp.]|jgi:hypothetical protein|uniref:RagB/SusD family nutrient uptake outer membrane protein n=1 Tax=Mucilaginibacter sp. TaxID=1882438 RepID=UPI003563A61C
MKKTLKYSIIWLALIITSCNKELNQIPISSATTATFYSSPSDFVQGVNAIYSGLRSYPNRLLNLSEIRSDNIYGVSSQGIREWDPVNNFQKASGANVYVEEAWATDFNSIYRANVVMDQLAKNGDKIGSAPLQTRLTAETRFLRAFYYFDLVRYYGKLPLVTTPLTPAEANTVGRSSVADVYNLIISDLQYAAANLPVQHTGADVGRATKYAAEATLALVYMTRSGPTYGVDGPGLATNEWGLALPLLQDIINSGLFAMNIDYASIFSYSNQSPTPSGNKEAVFDIMYTSGQSPSVGASFSWTLAPRDYFFSIKDINQNGSLEIVPVSDDFMNSYETGDLRKAVSVFTAGYAFSGNAEKRPFFKKYLDVTKIPSNSNSDWAINFIAIRYTDILLLKAECVLHGAPGSQGADVDAVVNTVRARAGLSPLVNVTLTQLFNERRKEFAAEGSRWFDLQRSGNLLTTMNAWIASEDAKKLKQINPVIPGYVVYPIPQSQLDALPGLYTQNTGY